MSQKKFESVILLKVYFRTSDAFQQLFKTVKNTLKLLHCKLKTTLAQPRKREDGLQSRRSSQPAIFVLFVTLKFYKLQSRSYKLT